MSEEERRGFRSSFFFCPPDPVPRHEYDPLYRMSDRIGFAGKRLALANVLRIMVERGHEVGLHASYLSHRDGRELGRQRGRIGEAAGRDVRGLRQHFLRFDVGATWSAQEAAGFQHDCTLGYNEAIGFRAAIAAPFRPWRHEARKRHELIALPTTCMDGVVFRTLKLDTEQAVERVLAHLRVVEEAGGLAVLLWHPNAGDERHFPGWLDCYLRALDHLVARGAWVAPAVEIADWWRSRSRLQNEAARD
jgi:peptidoglycan/xylan/chitin deacetylase (PgdA/CDA1 family)